MNDLTSHHQVGGAILVCSYPGMVAETQDRIGLEERLSKRVRFRILRALAILIFLLLGAGIRLCLVLPCLVDGTMETG